MIKIKASPPAPRSKRAGVPEPCAIERTGSSFSFETIFIFFTGTKKYNKKKFSSIKEKIFDLISPEYVVRPDTPLRRRGGGGEAFFILALFLSSCTIAPEPIHFGKDACEHCKMLIMDIKFGAEIVTQKGKVFKFDDINCMVEFKREKDLQEADIAYQLVVDFHQTKELLSAEKSFYIFSEEIRTPMASKVAAFENEETGNPYLQKFPGKTFTWKEINELF